MANTEAFTTVSLASTPRIKGLPSWQAKATFAPPFPKPYAIAITKPRTDWIAIEGTNRGFVTTTCASGEFRRGFGKSMSGRGEFSHGFGKTMHGRGEFSRGFGTTMCGCGRFSRGFGKSMRGRGEFSHGFAMGTRGSAAGG